MYILNILKGSLKVWKVYKIFWAFDFELIKRIYNVTFYQSLKIRS